MISVHCFYQGIRRFYYFFSLCTYKSKICTLSYNKISIPVRTFYVIIAFFANAVCSLVYDHVFSATSCYRCFSLFERLYIVVNSFSILIKKICVSFCFWTSVSFHVNRSFFFCRILHDFFLWVLCSSFFLPCQYLFLIQFISRNSRPCSCPDKSGDCKNTRKNFPAVSFCFFLFGRFLSCSSGRRPAILTKCGTLFYLSSTMFAIHTFSFPVRKKHCSFRAMLFPVILRYS